jgi:hypothetical protein
LVFTGVLIRAGLDQYLAVTIVVFLGGAYFWRRDRSDAYKERLAALEVEKIERERGAAVREKARKRLSRTQGSGNRALERRDENDAANG